MQVEELEDGYKLVFKQFNKEYTAYYKSNGDFLRFDGDEFSPYKVNLIKILTEYNQSHAYSSTANNIITKLIKISEECEQLKNENVQLKDEVNLKNIELDDMQTTVRKRIEENTEQTNKMTAGYVESINNVELMKVVNNQDDIQAQLTKNAIIVYGKDFPSVYYSLTTNTDESAKITGGIIPPALIEVAVAVALPIIKKYILPLFMKLGSALIPALLSLISKLLPEAMQILINAIGKIPIIGNVLVNFLAQHNIINQDSLDRALNEPLFQKIIKVFAIIKDEVSKAMAENKGIIKDVLAEQVNEVMNNNNIVNDKNMQSIIASMKSNSPVVLETNQIIGGLSPMISYEFPDEFYNELCELLYDNLDEDINIDVSSVESFNESVNEIENELNKLFGGEDMIYKKRIEEFEKSIREIRKYLKEHNKYLEEHIEEYGKDEKLESIVSTAKNICNDLDTLTVGFQDIPKTTDNITNDDAVNQLRSFSTTLDEFAKAISACSSKVLSTNPWVSLLPIVNSLEVSKQVSNSLSRTIKRCIKNYEKSNKKLNEEQNEESNDEFNDTFLESHLPNKSNSTSSNKNELISLLKSKTKPNLTKLDNDAIDKLEDLQNNLRSIPNNINNWFTTNRFMYENNDKLQKELQGQITFVTKSLEDISNNISECINKNLLSELNKFRTMFKTTSEQILSPFFNDLLKRDFMKLKTTKHRLEIIKKRFERISNDFLDYASDYISKHEHDSQEHDSQEHDSQEHDSQDHNMKGGKKHKFKMTLKALCKLLKTRDMIARYIYPILEHSDYRNDKEDIANAISLIKIFENHPKTSKDVDYIMSLLRKAIPSIDSTNLRDALLSRDYSKVDFYPLLESKGRKLFTLLFNNDDKNNTLPLDAVPSIQVIDDLKNSVPNLYSELLKLHERCSLKLIQQQTVRDEYLKKVTSLSREGSSIYIFFIILFAVIIIVCISIAIVNTRRIVQNKHDQLSQVPN